MQADQVPLEKLDLKRWTSDAQRISCAEDLECARADLSVRPALRVLGPVLGDLPFDTEDIHDAKLEAGIGKSDRKPRFLRVTGEVDAGGLLGDVNFELELNLPR